MQRSMDLFVSDCAHFGLTVTTDKTVVIHQQPLDAEYSVPRIRVNGTELKPMDNINYLATAIAGSTTAPASTSTSTTSAPTLTSAASTVRAAMPSATNTSTTFASNTGATSNTTISATTANVPTTTRTFTITTLTSSGVDSAHTCPHCDRTFTSHIDLVGHLRIHRTETGEPVPGAPTYTRRIRLHCPHCPRKFTHRVGLFGHIRIHESGINRDIDTPSTSCTPNIPSSINMVGIVGHDS
ncbi:hypothetical protein SprV_0200677200 [Sparganum proliferum]